MNEMNPYYQHLVRQDCPLPPGTPVFIYCRDSGGEEQDRSVTQQVQAARGYCTTHLLSIQHIYIDEAKLSSNTEKRDELREMLSELRHRFKPINDRYKRERIAREKPFGVIFWKSSRLGRDSIEATNIKTDLRLRGITILDLVTSANTGNSAIDALIEAFQQWQDEQLLNDISRDAKRGLAQLVGTRDNDPEFLKYNPDWQPTGAYVGIMPGSVPKGFKGERVQVGIYKRKNGRATGDERVVQRLVPDPETWDRAYQAWKLRNGGASIKEVHEATRLFANTNGYGTFFANSIYTGDLEYGGVIYKNFVPPMIPREWFEDEQKRRKERSLRRQKGGVGSRDLEAAHIGSEALLSSLVYCGAIPGEEHPMHAESIPAKKGKRGTYRFFICNVAKNSRGARCHAKRISMKALDKAVTGALMDDILTLENLRPLANTLSSSLEERTRDAEIRMDTLENELHEVRQSIDNILDAIEKMGYAAHLKERYDARKLEETNLLSEIAQLDALRATSDAITHISGKALEDWINYIRASLQSGSRPIAKRLLQQFIERIVVDRGEITLYYIFPLGEELYMSSFDALDPRGALVKTRQQYRTSLDTPQSTVSNRLNPDKRELYARAVELHMSGKSVREIGRALGIHWTRVHQLLRQKNTGDDERL